MGPGDWADLFFATSLALSATSITFLVAWLRARDRAIRAELRLEERGSVPDAAALGQREGDLEAIAAEVARLGEGQRFMVELLKQRKPAAVPSGPAPESPSGSQ